MQAKYPGKCSRCQTPIKAGDEITWNRKHKGQVNHISCPSPQRPSLDDICSCGHRYGQHGIETDSCKAYKCHCPKFTPTTNGTDETNMNHTEGYVSMTTFELIKSHRTRNGSSFIEAKNAVDAGWTPENDEDFTAFDAPKTTDRGTNGNDLASVIALAIASHLPATSAVDSAQVRAIVKEELTGMNALPTRVEVVALSQEVKDMGIQHKQFPTLLQVIGQRLNVWLAGPAGSGKTTACHNVATALDLPFRFCGAQSNEYGLLGFIAANGQVVRTQFREAYEHGGVFLFDEIDASSPAALLAFNAALANGVCAFPDVVISRHSDFIAVAAANTFGLGGTNDYVGRAKQDAAFLDRFVYLTWEVDEVLERSTVGNDRWVSRVQNIRAKVHSKGLKVLITPRASYYGAKLLAAGMDQSLVETMVLRKGMTDEQWGSL